MPIYYKEKGEVKFSMQEYIKKLLEESARDMDQTTKTPASNHLFNISKEATKFPHDKSELLPHIIAKLLYLCSRTHQDIQTAVAFLCT